MSTAILVAKMESTLKSNLNLACDENSASDLTCDELATRACAVLTKEDNNYIEETLLVVI